MVMRCVKCGISPDLYSQSNLISFHKFPKDEVKREKWCLAMGLSTEQLSKSSLLCSLHFEENCYKSSTKLCDTLSKRLKSDAVPSIRNIFDNEIEENNESIDKKVSEENKLTSKENVQMEIGVDSEKNESINKNVIKLLTEETSFNSTTSNKNEILKKSFDCENTSDIRERHVRVGMEKMSKSSKRNETGKKIEDFETHLEFSGRLKKITNIKWNDISHSLPLCKIYFEEAQDVIADLEKKLKSIGHRKWRLEKRVKSLDSMLKVMKNQKLLRKEMTTKLEVNKR